MKIPVVAQLESGVRVTAIFASASNSYVCFVLVLQLVVKGVWAEELGSHFRSSLKTGPAGAYKLCHRWLKRL